MPGKVLDAVTGSCAVPLDPPPPREKAPVLLGRNGVCSVKILWVEAGVSLSAIEVLLCYMDDHIRRVE